MKTPNIETLYEIRIKGHLGQNTLTWFEDFQAEFSGSGETILRGSIIDQSALQGILMRICELGLELTLFKRMEE